ncbi:MAG: GNAT family N-acetyltransferase [Caulobacteraceae bacterium]|nr:GNAT family N-acetyltransferase [Caulobacteraceae bacterium]
MAIAKWATSTWTLMQPPRWSCTGLYVDTSTKGTGVARTLMDDALAWARSKGAKVMFLSVWENNARAQAFYKRYGFEHVKEHKFMVGRVADRDFIWRLV